MSLPRVKLTRSSLGRRYEPIRPLGTDEAPELVGTTGDPEPGGLFDAAFMLFVGVPCRLCICVPCPLCIPELGEPVLFDAPTELSFVLRPVGVPCPLCIPGLGDPVLFDAPTELTVMLSSVGVPCPLCIPEFGDPVLFGAPTELTGGLEVTFFD